MKGHNIQEVVSRNRIWIAVVSVAIIVTGAFVYSFLRIVSLEKNVESLSQNLASTTALLYGTADSLSKNVTDLRSQTVGISETLSSAQQNISAVQSQVGGVEQAVGSISGTVSTLQKLVAIDPELLKKYSKVYFLNENYTPAHLLVIPQSYVYSNSVKEQFLQEAWPFLQKLLDAAKSGGVILYVKSAYRSYAEQQTLKSAYTIIYGAGTANSFAADQGYSEHQLGVTLDFMTGGLNGELSDSFDSTLAYQWLKLNAHKFGFELSYPKGNAYYVYEPWHWRFVGVKLATFLHDNKMNYYDMDQRDIDTYIASLFD